MDDILGGFFNWVITTIFELTGATASQLNISNGTIQSIHDVWNYFIMAGIGLTIVYFIIDLNRKWMFEGQNMSIKSMAVPFLKLVIAIILMANAAKLFGALCSFNNGFAEALERMDFRPGSLTIDDNLGSDIMKQLGFWEKIIMIFPLIVGFAVGIICNLVWAYKALIYKIELIVRTAFAPVALADIYSGLNASAIKYIKGTIALILYGGCLIILPKVTLAVGAENFNIMMEQMTNVIHNTSFGSTMSDIFNVILSWFELIICPIAGIGLCGAAKALTKEAMGA